jgi:mannosyltransferase OCH1-like enzyme
LIPRIIHYCWLGDAEPSAEMEASMATWRQQLPTYAVQERNESNLPDDPYVERAVEAGKWSRASNAIRLHALYEYGGVYLDTDVDVVRSFDPLLGLGCFLGFQFEPDGTARKPLEQVVNGAVMGSTPRHPFVAHLLGRIPRDDPRPEALELMGPELITAGLFDWGLEGWSPEPVTVRGVTVLPKEAFYPYFYGDDPPESVGPETFAIHRWAKRW